MRDKRTQLYATDKDLFDLLISPKQRITERVMLELARDRGIFCSHKASREKLASYLSGLTHDLNDVEGLIKQGESGTRGEKTTFLTIGAEIDAASIRRAVNEYAKAAGTEIVAQPVSGATKVTTSIQYDEFDYSRTNLLQRQTKVADIEFSMNEGQVRVRLPSTDKAKDIVAKIIDLVERDQKTTLPQTQVTVDDLPPEYRTRFFLHLTTKMAGYRTDTVTKLKVAAKNPAPEDDDDDAADKAESKMLHLVQNVALTGENLLVSPQYRQLTESGFFVTSMTWRATQLDEPQDRVQFDVSFENGRAGTGFRYLMRIAERSSRHTYPQNFSAPSDGRKRHLFSLVESTAHSVVAALRAELDDAK
ncbi:hypothetical protein G6L33_11165 [Agrobacterium rhizogenes]|nr:hypothetical protein [Rhizobium rhizogenes]